MMYPVGYILCIPVMYMFLTMMDSMNHYHVKETCDTYLLCQRIEELENDMVILKDIMDTISKDVEPLTREYVEVGKYNMDNQSIADDIRIMKTDIDTMKRMLENLAVLG